MAASNNFAERGKDDPNVIDQSVRNKWNWVVKLPKSADDNLSGVGI